MWASEAQGPSISKNQKKSFKLGHFYAKFLLFRTHHLWNSTTELILDCTLHRNHKLCNAFYRKSYIKWLNYPLWFEKKNYLHHHNHQKKCQVLRHGLVVSKKIHLLFLEIVQNLSTVSYKGISYKTIPSVAIHSKSTLCA